MGSLNVTPVPDNTNSQYIFSMLPDFNRWARLNKDSTVETIKKQVYILSSILKRYPRFNLNTCQDFVLDSKGIKKSSTIEKYIHAMRVFCDFLVSNAIIDKNFAREILIPKREKTVPVILTIKEIEDIINVPLLRTYGHYPDPKRAKYVYDVILGLLAKTGARLGEVLGMKIGDVSYTEGVWTLQHSKTKVGRLIPIPPDMIDKIKDLAGDRKPDEFIFINDYNGKTVRHHQVERNFRLRLKACQINKLATVHTLRHSFITELLRQDVSVLKIANIVGHENIKTTQDYSRLLYEDLRDAILRHPLTSKDRNPQDILNQFKETVDKSHLKDDPRFSCKVTELNNMYQVSIMIV